MKVSVALCTYNGEKYIKQQLESIINQTLVPDEIVICDDCSKDSTVSMVNDMLSSWGGRLIVKVNEENLGFVKNFEQAISLCTGDIIFLSDQDDVWDLSKIEIISRVFEEDKDAVMVFHDAEVVDQNLKTINPSFWNILEFNYMDFLKNDYRHLEVGNVVQGSASAIRKELVDYAKPIPPMAWHDEWLALCAISLGKLIPIPQKLLKYRQTGHNALGAMTVKSRGINKLKKWLNNYKEVLFKGKENLVRHQKVLRIYDSRYRIFSGNDFRLQDALTYFTMRIKVNEGNFMPLLKNFPLYFKVMDKEPKVVLKEIIKDVWEGFIN